MKHIRLLCVPLLLAAAATGITACSGRDSGGEADAIVLGCAGMADLAADLAGRHGVPVVDGVAAAVKLAEGLVSLRLVTSQSGPFRHTLVA